MFGMNIHVPEIFYVDNVSVLNILTMPKLILNKKHISILYHKLYKAVAKGMFFFDVLTLTGTCMTF